MISTVLPCCLLRGPAAMNSSVSHKALFHVLLPLILVGLVMLVMAPAFDAEFLDFDDDRNFVNNGWFPGLSAQHFQWMFTTGWMGHYQPLSWLSANLDWLASGAGALDARPLHRTNVVLHALTAVGVYLLALRILRTGPVSWPVAGASFLGAALFAVHPMRVESVAWVTERRDVLSGVFFVGCVLAWTLSAPRVEEVKYHVRTAVLGVAAATGAVILFVASVDRSVPDVLSLGAFGAPGLFGSGLLTLVALGCAWKAAEYPDRARIFGGYAIAWACLCLSLLAKAWGIVLPALLIVVDLAVLRRGTSATRLLLEKVGFVPPVAAAGVLAAWAQMSQVETFKTISEHGLLARLVQAGYGLAYYPFKTLVPTALSPLHPIPDSFGLTEARFGLSALAVVLGTIALIVWRRRFRAVLWTWIAFAVIVSPVLGLLQSGPQLVAERYSYLSCIPFALIAGAGLVSAARGSRWVRCLSWGPAVVLIVLFALQTRRYTAVWGSSEKLWSYALEQEPDSSTACINLGSVRLSQAKSESDPVRKRELILEAKELSQRDLDLGGTHKHLINLALAHSLLAEVDSTNERQHRRAALDAIEQAMELVQHREEYDPQIRFEYGVHLYNYGDYSSALREFDWFTRARPRRVNGWLSLGHTSLWLQQPDRAREAYQRVLDLDPTHTYAAQQLSAMGQ